jgi:hypothetical protein
MREHAHYSCGEIRISFPCCKIEDQEAHPVGRTDIGGSNPVVPDVFYTFILSPIS